MSESLNYFLPYQQRWITSNAKLAIGEKSRRIGWTYASSYRAVERRLRADRNHGNLYFSSADLSAAREFIDYCRKWAELFNAVSKFTESEEVVEEQKILKYEIEFANGRRIVAGSSNPKFFRSKGGDADGDEFAFHEDPAALTKAMHATALFRGDYQMRLWSTHNGEDSYFNKMLQAVEKGKLQAEVHRTTILDAVEQGIVEQILGLKGRDDKARKEWLDQLRSTCPDEDTWNQEYMCRPSSEQTSLLNYSLIESCENANLQLVEAIQDLPLGGSPLYAGFDVGRRKDLSVLWVNERVGDVHRTRMVKVFAGVSFTAQESVCSLLLMNPAVRRLCIDETGIGMMLAERLKTRFGYRVEPVMFTAGVKGELAMPLVRLFEDKLVRIPDDADIRDDLHKVRKIVTAAGNVRFDADRDAGGHADRFWALALACHAADSAKAVLPPPAARKPVGW